MILYPYNTPLILTDELFGRLGGNVDSTPFDLRQMAYAIAEGAVYYDIETPLTPTTFTGTYAYAERILLDHTYVQQVYQMRVLDQTGAVSVTLTGSNQLFLENPEIGILRFTEYYYGYCYQIFPTFPYQVQVIYRAGLSSGTSYDPRLLMGLTKYATVQINEMIGYGNETTGDVGVDTFKTLDYFEKRMPMLRTAYGNSAQAQFIHHMLSPFRKRRHVGW